jgi:hypothetical protein
VQSSGQGSRTRAAILKARYATLVNVHHLRPWEIAKLTDRQIEELYFHPREQDGSITPVEDSHNREPKSLDEAIAQWVVIASQFRTPQDKVQAGIEMLRQKWAAKEESGQ